MKRITVVSLFCCLLVSVVSAQVIDSDGAFTNSDFVPPSPRGLDISAQNVLPELESTPQDPAARVPLWQHLEGLGQKDRENALINFEYIGQRTAEAAELTGRIEDLWKVGIYDEAIALLRKFEESPKKSAFAIVISWKQPRLSTGPGLDWGTDIQVETRGEVHETTLDYHAVLGRLFVVTRRTGGAPQWTVNRSTDRGQTWEETDTWMSASGDIKDLSAVVLDQYLYISYAPEDLSGAHTEARMRRAFVGSGNIDNIYDWVEIFDMGVEIEELALTSNADEDNDWLRHVAILSDGSLIYHQSSDFGYTYGTYPSGVTDAAYSLDACYNEGWSTYHTCVSFHDADDNLSVWLKPYGEDPVLFDLDTVHPTLHSTTGIAAYNDVILVVFDHDYTLGPGIRYQISYDGGSSWLWGTLDEPDVGGDFFSDPSATGRGGAGFSVVYQEEAGTFDPCYYRHRDYDFPPTWTDPVTLNEEDVITGAPLSAEAIPGIAGFGISYGVVWISGAHNAYFDRADSGFNLSIDPLPPLGGTSADFVVTGGTANANTWLVYSLIGTGSTYIAPLDVTLDLDNPVLGAGPSMTDGSGMVSWTLPVPAVGIGRDVWIQAVQYGQVTNVVATTIE